MKKILLGFLLIIIINSANAQFGANNAIYLTEEFNMGNYYGIDLNLNYIYKEKYSFKFGYSGNIRKPKTQPADYSSGFIGIFALQLSNPHDQFQNYQIAAGKIYKLNNKGTIRANLSVGIGFTIITEPENWQKYSSGVIGENYSWQYNSYNTVSILINPKLEFPFSRIFGFTLSPMIQISKNRTYYGIGIGEMIGLLRKKNMINREF